ncbi:MAG TPA: FG-GAP repeat protein [Polyangiales bacterium]|nr:FG-GAP repeat protein [Polyangiales bacterium]
MGVALLLIVSGACTPINQVKRMESGQDEPDAGPSAKATDADAATEMTEPSAPGETSAGKVVTQSTPCANDGARACEGHGVREVSICKGGKWESDTPCKTNERCDSAQGKCAPVAAICAGQEAGAEFCDGDRRLVCTDLVAASERACGANELCSRKDGKVSCTCAPGAVPSASGTGCDVVSGCGDDGSGCDPLTRCISNGCTPCPAGYVGDGRKGCVPQLETLSIQCEAAGAVRALELTSGVYEYRSSVPMLCQSATLTAAGPANTQIEVDGKSIEPGTPWSSPLLHVGDNPVKLVVTAQSGRSSSYQLKIVRDGSKCDYLKASNAGPDDSFGFGIAADGNRLLIGAPFEASDGTSPDNNSLRNSGAAYVFELEADKWVEKQLIKAEQPSDGDMFGASVAISGDLLVVGAPRYNLMLFKVVPPTGPGTAYVFRREGRVWKQDGQLNPSEGSGADMFGSHVSVLGDTVLVGAPYDSTGGSHAGAVYSFAKSNGVWSQQQKIIPNKPVAEASFGISNAIEKDTFVAGAMQDSSMGEASGSAYVFTRNGGMWVEQERLLAPSPKPLATFGMSVQIRSGRILVTAPGLDLRQRQTPAGEAYLFELDAASGKRVVTARVRAAIPHSIDLFGGAAALNANGIMIGANGDNSSSRGIDGDPNRNDAELSGAAYVFGLQGMDYVQTAYIKAFNSEAQDNYGHSVAATESFLAVAAPFEGGAQRGVHTQDDADGASNSARSSGAVYVYR